MVVQRGQSTEHRGKWYEARTEFRRLRGRIFEATMRSGIMHQIRAHAAFVGIPIAGDRLYGGAAAESARPPGGPRFCLHHTGLQGPGEFRSEKVPTPDWAGGLGDL
jgi:23S rRNA-/tRNA-specific pseudouridylate synthase